MDAMLQPFIFGNPLVATILMDCDSLSSLFIHPLKRENNLKGRILNPLKPDSRQEEDFARLSHLSGVIGDCICFMWVRDRAYLVYVGCMLADISSNWGM
jgi:hypothetical protein